MGFDVYGKKPISETGDYFRNTVWWWRPLRDYICEVVAPDMAARCEHWGTNDGDGLDADDARALAQLLQAEIDAGRTEAYSLRYASRQESLPNEPCTICGGTGTRKSIPELGADDSKKDGIVCNGCDGSG